MHTEDEAKKLWCPFTRHANGSVGVGVNRVNWDRTYDYANCLASGCAAWRWSREGLSLQFDEKGPHLRSDSGEEMTGYCGLAGKP